MERSTLKKILVLANVFGASLIIIIVLCSFKGEPKSEWIKGKAQNITGDEAAKAIKLRKKKYGMSARLIGLFTSQKGNLIVYSIKTVD